MILQRRLLGVADSRLGAFTRQGEILVPDRSIERVPLLERAPRGWLEKGWPAWDMLSDPGTSSSATGTTNAASIVSPSISPSSDALIVASFSASRIGAASTSPTGSSTLTGIGTFTAVTVSSSVGGIGSLQGFVYALITGAPGSGTVTAGWTTDSLLRAIQVYEFTGYDTTTPIRQSKTATGTGATISATLDSTPLSDSCVVGAVRNRRATTGADPVPGSGFTQHDQDEAGTGAAFCVLMTMFDRDSATTTVDASGMSSVDNALVAIEVAAVAAAGGHPTARRFGLNAGFRPTDIGRGGGFTMIGA